MEVIAGHAMPRNQIPDLFTDEFTDLVNAWSLTKRWETMPFEGGWAEQPARLMDVLTAFDVAYNDFEEEKRKQGR